MTTGEWAAFVERSRDAIAESPGMGKRNTELRVVEPFLSALGWNVRSNAVTAAFEAANGTVVDYALCPEGRVGAFVAVVACEDSITTGACEELVAAMRASGVDRGVCTNGRRYVLLGLPSADDAREEGTAERSGNGFERLAFSLADLPEFESALRALSYDGVAAAVSSNSPAVAEALVAADEDVVDRVTGAVVDVAAGAGDTPPAAVAGEVRPLAREFIADVVDELSPADFDAAASTDGEGERDLAKDDPEQRTVGTTEVVDAANSTDSGAAMDSGASTEVGASTEAGASTDSVTAVDVEPSEVVPESSNASEVRTLSVADASNEQPEANRQSEASAAVANSVPGESATEQASSGEFVLRFFEDGRSVGAVGNPDADAAIALGARYLLEERGLGPRIQFPYAPVEDDLAFLNRQPEHPSGRAMAAALDLGGLYVDAGSDLDDRQAAVEALASRGGLRVMFSGDWPE